ncbi:MAG: hypothetical protein NTX66_00450 [Candidatus Falkowbacteria bacterium]|nr:hypothetical protein [Candidatus Falkowbacteria bacterium]
MPSVKKNKTAAKKSAKVISKTAPLAKTGRVPLAKALPRLALKSRPRSKSIFKKNKSAASKEVEVLSNIKPKRVAQAIDIEVAEDNFNSGAWDDLIDKDNNYNLADNSALAASVFPGTNRRPHNLKEAGSDLDKKEKFFNELAEEIKIKKEEGASSRENKTAAEGQEDTATPAAPEPEIKNFKKSAGLYRRLVIKFVLAVSVLVLVVAYFSFSKLTLLITPKTEGVDTSLEFNVYSPDSGFDTNSSTSTNQLVAGKIKEVAISGEKTYQSSGENVLGEEIVGQVKLINNYNKDQALVAKTRLLSPDNQLFRLKTAVNIPAGGEVEAAIYADEPSPELAISPTRFTIPGLWAGLQTKIYAESQDKFIFQNQIKKYIKPSDLDLAAKDMDNYLIAQAQNQAATDFSSDEIVVYKTDETKASSTIDAKAGDLKDQFNLKASGQVILVALPKQQTADMVKAKLGLSVSDDKELISFDSDNIVYVLEKYDPVTKVATVKAEGRGLMSLKKDSEVIDRTKLINLNREQIKEYLNNFPEISSYELKFYPSFINTAPGLVDRIQIQVSAPKE